MQKYTIDDYIALVEEQIAVFDRLNEVFQEPPSEEGLIEKEKFQALLGFLNEIVGRSFEIKATWENLDESIKNRINEEYQEHQ